MNLIEMACQGEDTPRKRSARRALRRDIYYGWSFVYLFASLLCWISFQVFSPTVEPNVHPYFVYAHTSHEGIVP